MTIPKLTPYTGQVANPDGSQTQTEFTQNMFDQLSYEAQLATQLDATIDGMNNAVDEVEANAVSAQNSANAAEAAASGLNYQGLWPDTGGSANKGDTWQTQVGGTPTGEYYTALQDTTVDPVGDNVNWKKQVSKKDVDSRVFYFNTLDDAVNSSDLALGASVDLKERVAGNGGGAMWDVVLASSVTPNTFNIVQCIGVPTLALSLQLNDTKNVIEFGAYNDGRNPTETRGAIQAALDLGGYIRVPHGTYYINDSLSINVANTELVGDSKVGTIIGADPSSTSLGANNSIITIDVQPLNGAIRNMRFKTFGAYTGWAITAGASINGFNGFSVSLIDLWNDFASSAAGFYRGGFYDGFVDRLQLDVTRKGFNLTDGGNRSFFDNINANGMFGEFMIHDAAAGAGFSYGNVVSNLVATNHVGNASSTAGRLFRLKNADKWQIHDIHYDAGNASFDPDTGYNMFAELESCDIDFDSVHIGVRRGNSLLSSFDITNSKVRFNNLTVTHDDEVPLDLQRLKDTFTFHGTVDCEIQASNILGGDLATFNFDGCSGKFKLKGSTVSKSKRKITRTFGDLSSIDITIDGGNEITDAYYGEVLANFQTMFFLITTGDVRINNNKIGAARAEAVGYSSIYDIRGAGEGSDLTGNIYINTETGNLNESTHIPIKADISVSKQLADEEVILLPENTVGMIHTSCGGEMGGFVIDSASSTKAYGTANTINTNTDGKLAVYYSAKPRVANRLGSALDCTVIYNYR